MKSRAKGCIATRNYPAAIQLYTKALEVTSSDDASACSILHANRSMCHINMGSFQIALDDANQAESRDPSYLKAYYRKATALKALSRLSEARDVLLKGLSLKADDKELKTLLSKIEEEMKAVSSNGPVVKPARTTVSTSSNSSTTQSAPKVAAAASSSSTSKTKPIPSSESVPMEEEDPDLSTINMRGYKKTADGRMTTFFNNELDETAKRLIGDIAPKKIDDSFPVRVAPASTENGSVWNTAGTYEERVLTSWATDYLKEAISSMEVKIQRSNVINKDQLKKANLESVHISVMDIENVVGDAQVSMARGKKKYICDYCLDLKWRLTVNYEDNAAAEVVIGKVSVLDVTADKDYEITNLCVTNYNASNATASTLPTHLLQLHKLYVSSTSTSQDGLHKLIHNYIIKFCDQLKLK